MPAPPHAARDFVSAAEIGRFEARPANAITDVAGVRVEHVTVWRDEPEPPAGRGVARASPQSSPQPPRAPGASPSSEARRAILNSAGELTSFVQIASSASSSRPSTQPRKPS